VESSEGAEGFRATRSPGVWRESVDVDVFHHLNAEREIKL